MNVMDVTKAWFALISASGTTNDVSKRKHDFYRHSMLYLYYRNYFKFLNGQTSEIGVNNS